MKNNQISRIKKTIWLALAGGALVFGTYSQAQNPPANLSPGVGDIGKLVAAKVGDETVLNFIRGSGVSYHLSSDDIIYLTGQGVSPAVMSALLASKPSSPTFAPSPVSPAESAPAVGNAPASVPPPTPVAPPSDGSAAPSPDINLPYFQTQLNPYGTWMDLPPYGQVWRPAAAADPTWRPYGQGGHWVFTDAGWYWQADDPWGAVVFHYGRWTLDPGYGWLWVPGYNWAPSWVVWRHSEGYYGWAPLPPSAEFITGVGIGFHGVAVGASFDFGLGAGMFTFVGYDHLWDHDYRAFWVPRDRVGFVFRGSLIEGGFHLDHGRFVVLGFGRDHIFAHTGRAVVVVDFHRQMGFEHEGVRRAVEEHRVAVAHHEEAVRHEEAVHHEEAARRDEGRGTPGRGATPAGKTPARGRSSGKSGEERKP